MTKVIIFAVLCMTIMVTTVYGCDTYSKKSIVPNEVPDCDYLYVNSANLTLIMNKIDEKLSECGDFVLYINGTRATPDVSCYEINQSVYQYDGDIQDAVNIEVEIHKNSRRVAGKTTKDVKFKDICKVKKEHYEWAKETIEKLAECHKCETNP